MAIVEFAPQAPGLGIIDSVLKHHGERANGKLPVDYAFHEIVMDASQRLFDELPKSAENGDVIDVLQNACVRAGELELRYHDGRSGAPLRRAMYLADVETAI